MKIQFNQPTWKTARWLTMSFILVVSFQNCNKAGFDSALDESLASSSVSADLTSVFGQSDAVKVNAAPFAFNFIADQISYNSCTGASLSTNPNAFYSFKIGSYSSGGVALRQSFLNYLKTNFLPVYPATTLSNEQIKNYLYYSPENSGAAPQLAIRTRGKPQVLRTPSGNTATAGTDYIYALGDLTNDRYMDNLVKAAGVVTNYFPYATEAASRIPEAVISYNTDEGLAQNLRNDFRNTAQLALTYTSKTATDAFAARYIASSTDTTKAYGIGYNLTFSVDVAPFTATVSGVASPIPKSNNPNNILTAIQEVNLESPSVSSGATWNCSANRRYAIVRSQDASLCPRESSSLMSDATYRKELEIVRHHLRSEDWDVNISLRCVVPKVGSCYPTEVLNGATVQIQYDQTKECYQGVDTQSFDNAASPPTKRCAHYVSICVRN